MQEESQASNNPLPPEILFGTSRRRRAAPPGGDVSLGYAEARSDYARVEPVNVSVVPKAVVHRDEVYKIIVAKAGDTLPLVLRAFGASEADAQAITARMSGWKVGKPGLFAGGEKITVVEDSFDRNDEKAAAKPLRVIVEGLSPQAAAVVLSDNGDYIGDVDLPHDANADGGQTHISAGDGASPGVTAEESVKDNLYALAKVNNVDRSLIDNVVRLCAHDIDLDEPASADDAVDLLYSAGETGEAELAYVGLTIEGKALRYYRFASPADNSSDYYDQNGHSITQFLLRKPVAAGRLGDGFGWRTHPVLHDRRFHEGVDYAAPYGSPIAAAGAGVVEKIDQEWGYGKYIRVRHDQGY
jgi:murein DD-endopeptidase MepM/ murein hydrolase activator NlpD